MCIGYVLGYSEYHQGDCAEYRDSPSTKEVMSIGIVRVQGVYRDSMSTTRETVISIGIV